MCELHDCSKDVVDPLRRKHLSINQITLECPCCGDEGASADKDGLFWDEQSLECGCPGHVVVDEDDVWINNGDQPCPRCDKEQSPGR